MNNSGESTPEAQLTADDFLVSDWENTLTSIMDWSPDNASFDADGSIDLTLDASTDGIGKPYEGAEIESLDQASLGTWSWISQAPEMVDGAVFAMFTYKADHSSQPWIEYDFEFVGHDTTQVQLTVHMEDANGQHVQNFGEVIVDLGFDAAEDQHLYQITVNETNTEFLVDNEVLWTFTSEDMPDNIWYTGDMRSFTSIWAADETLVDWTGAWEYPGKPLTANILGIGTPDKPLSQDFIDEVLNPLQVTYGSAADDVLFGGTGRDEIFGYRGNDKLGGGADDDIVRGGQGSDRIYGGSGHDELGGGSGDDTLYGGADDDTLYGSDGNDRLWGGDGNDHLYGGSGRDELRGGSGDDTLWGGAGRDVFVFGANHGTDQVADFNPDEDQLNFAALGISGAQSFADLGFATGDGNLIIDTGAGSVVLVGLAHVEPSAEWFAF